MGSVTATCTYVYPSSTNCEELPPPYASGFRAGARSFRERQRLARSSAPNRRPWCLTRLDLTALAEETPHGQRWPRVLWFVPARLISIGPSVTRNSSAHRGEVRPAAPIRRAAAAASWSHLATFSPCALRDATTARARARPAPRQRRHSPFARVPMPCRKIIVAAGSERVASATASAASVCGLEGRLTKRLCQGQHLGEDGQARQLYLPLPMLKHPNRIHNRASVRRYVASVPPAACFLPKAVGMRYLPGFGGERRGGYRAGHSVLAVGRGAG